MPAGSVVMEKELNGLISNISVIFDEVKHVCICIANSLHQDEKPFFLSFLMK